MIFKKMPKNLICFNLIIYTIISFTFLHAENSEFNTWVNKFKKRAVSYGVSQTVVDEVMSEAKFLPKVIEYDRYQPEFYEDTYTYIKKRASSKKVKKGLNLYKKEKKNYRYSRKKIFNRKRTFISFDGN